MEFSSLQAGEHDCHANDSVANTNQRQQCQRAHQPLPPRSCGLLRCFFRMLPRKMQKKTLSQRPQCLLPKLGEPGGMLHEVQNPRPWTVCTFHLLDLKFFGPSDDRTPDELIQQ